jgi:methanogenic corrinoid protein MtbC1
VGVATLRAWERRYGLFSPARSDGGFRLYSPAEEERVRQMSRLLQGGLSAAEAAKVVLESPDRETIAADPGEIVRELSAALEKLDAETADRILDRALSTLAFETVAEEVVLPVLREIGEGWTRGTITVSQEHFASNLLRGRLLALARGWANGIGPSAVLACPPGEQHDLGMIIFGLALRRQGWRIVYLGPDTPVGSVVKTAFDVDADAVVMAALSAERLNGFRSELRELGSLRALALGGPPEVLALANEVGARPLEGGLMAEAKRLNTLISPGSARN